MRDAATTTTGTSGKKVLFVMLGILVLAVGAGILIPAKLARSGEVTREEDFGTVPAFSLIDERGEVFTEEALRGHPTIVDIIFTRCDTICPVISMKMARLQDKLSDRKAESIKLLSISIDPEYDTPERLAEFAKRYNARADKWRFVTGDKKTIVDLVTNTFMSSAAREPDRADGVPQITHSSYFLLVDADLVIRGVYDSSEVTKLDELELHARRLARTQKRAHKFGE